MQLYNTCFEIAKNIIINDYQGEEIDIRKLFEFEGYCNMIDTLVNEYNADTINVITKDQNIVIRVECYDFELDFSTNAYKPLIIGAESLRFYRNTSDKLIIEFTFGILK